METLMGIKELYQMTLKANYPITIGNRLIEPGEVIARFDNIQLANFQEVKSSVTAHGGYNDWSYIYWDSTKEVDLVFSQGIFSKTHLAILSNAKLITIEEDKAISVTETEELESDINGVFTLLKTLGGDRQIYIYKKETGEKITNFQNLDNKHFRISDPFTDLIVDYTYDYTDGGQVVEVGNQLLQGFVSLEARTKTKDDITGKVRTCILKIPKLKIMSELSMRLGENAIPMVATFKAIGCPEGSKGTGKVMELYFLNDEIDSDM